MINKNPVAWQITPQYILGSIVAAEFNLFALLTPYFFFLEIKFIDISFLGTLPTISIWNAANLHLMENGEVFFGTLAVWFNKKLRGNFEILSA